MVRGTGTGTWNMVLCFYTPLPHVFNSYLPIWLYMAKQASWTHSICFIPHVASSRNPHDILFFLSKQEQAGYSAIFLCKAEKGRSRPHRPCAQTVIWCYTDYRWHSQQLVFTPKSSLWSTAKAQALLPPHIFIALRAAFCLSESVPEVKCKFIIIYSLCNILLQYLYRLRWPAHYVVGCCYPALMSMGTTVYAAPGKNATAMWARRQLSSELMDTMPIWYNGYKLYNPWTTPAENLGWSLLLIGGGTAAVINKINGLAWSVLALANLTETALSLLNDEVKQIRDAVVQNRLALDMLSSERVFVRCWVFHVVFICLTIMISHRSH